MVDVRSTYELVVVKRCESDSVSEVVEVVFRVQREWEYMYLVSSQGRCSSCNDNGELSSPFSIPPNLIDRVCVIWALMSSPKCWLSVEMVRNSDRHGEWGSQMFLWQS